MTPRPKKEEESKNWIVRLFKAMNSNWASRTFSIIIIFLIISGYFFYLTKGAVKQDCSQCEADKKVLVDVLLQVKQEMNNLAKGSISSNLKFNSGVTIAFPYIDTLPKKKKKDSTKRKTSVPPKPAEQKQEVKVATKLILKIDSVLRQVQQQQQQKKGN